MNSRAVRWLLIGSVTVAALVATRFLPVGDALAQAAQWIRGAGPLGVAVFAGLYMVGAVLVLPGSILTVAAGFAYGPLWGSLLVSPVSILAAMISFALARSLLRQRFERRFAGDPRFAAIDRAVGDRGFALVALLRLSPVFPYSILNYALGLTQVRRRDYLFASAIGMLPGTVLYVYLGSLASNTSELLAIGSNRGTGQQAFYWMGLLITVVVTVWIARIARRALAGQLHIDSAASPSPETALAEVR